MSGPAQVASSKRFACVVCHKWFSSLSYLKQHETVIHLDSGNFRCSYCSKSFRCSAECKAHERLHTGERPFRCEICHIRFNTKTNLTVHHLDHHAEKKFRCEICGERFGRKPRLQIHHQRHSSERLECGLCEASFRQKSNLTRHQRLYHPGAQQKTSDRIRFSKGDKKKHRVKVTHRVKVIQSNRSDDSVRKTYHLRTRGKPVNYREYEDGVESEENNESRSSGNSESDYQDNDDEPSEPDEAARSDNVLEEDDKRRIEREHDSDSETTSPDEPSESSAVCSANLKVVFGVEYKAPD